MEINVTKIVNAIKEDETQFSASVFETGLSDIGKITYQNACKFSKQFTFGENKEELKEWLGGFGAWDEEEINGWTDQELIGLFIQFVSDDYRELERLCEDFGSDIDNLTDEEFHAITVDNGGSISPNNGEWFYYVGN